MLLCKKLNNHTAHSEERKPSFCFNHVGSVGNMQAYTLVHVQTRQTNNDQTQIPIKSARKNLLFFLLLLTLR